MENLDKTLFTTDDNDLKKIYDEEAQKLRDNNFKLKILQKLNIEDFPKDLSDNSRRNIEKALLAIKIKDHMSLENGQTVLGLESFDLSKIQLSYQDKKLIKERFEHVLSLEKKKLSSVPRKTDELQRFQERFAELQQENISLNQLLMLREQKLDLMKEVANELVNPVQTKIVQGMLDDAKLLELKLKTINQDIQESEATKTSHAKKALLEVTKNIDNILQQKRENSVK